MLLASDLRIREHRQVVLNPFGFRRAQARGLGLGLVERLAWGKERRVCHAVRVQRGNETLVVGNLHDPATPYQGAKDLAKTMGNAALLTWDGEGHTSYLQGSSCVDDYVDNYLIAGTVPPPNTTCPR